MGAALLSAAAALVVRGPVDAVLFALVALGVLAPTAGRLPGPLTVAYGVGLLAAAWCGVLDLYETVWWLDALMHLVVTALVAAVAHLLLARTGAVVDPTAPGAPAAGVAVTAAFGLALSAVWEIAEYGGHAGLDPSIYVSPGDTVADTALGGIGSAVAGAILLRRARDSSAR